MAITPFGADYYISTQPRAQILAAIGLSDAGLPTDLRPYGCLEDLEYNGVIPSAYNAYFDLLAATDWYELSALEQARYLATSDVAAATRVGHLHGRLPSTTYGGKLYECVRLVWASGEPIARTGNSITGDVVSYTPAQLATFMAARDPLHRTIRLGTGSLAFKPDGIGASPGFDDRSPTNRTFIWADDWLDTLQPIWDEYFDALVTAGVDITHVSWDVETKWYWDNVRSDATLISEIRNDPRFPALQTLLGFDIADINTWPRYGTKYHKWQEVMFRRMSTYHDALYATFATYWPNVQFNMANGERKTCSIYSTDRMRSLKGAGIPVGTQASYKCYGAIPARGWWNPAINDFSAWSESNDWSRVVHELRSQAGSQAATADPLALWFQDYQDPEIGNPFPWTDLGQEMMRHCILGVSNNPLIGSIENGNPDLSHMDIVVDLLEEVDAATANEAGTPVFADRTTNTIGPWAVSGQALGDHTVYRISWKDLATAQANISETVDGTLLTNGADSLLLPGVHVPLPLAGTGAWATAIVPAVDPNNTFHRPTGTSTSTFTGGNHTQIDEDVYAGWLPRENSLIAASTGGSNIYAANMGNLAAPLGRIPVALHVHALIRATSLPGGATINLLATMLDGGESAPLEVTLSDITNQLTLNEWVWVKATFTPADRALLTPLSMACGITTNNSARLSVETMYAEMSYAGESSASSVDSSSESFAPSSSDSAAPSSSDSAGPSSSSSVFVPATFSSIVTAGDSLIAVPAEEYTKTTKTILEEETTYTVALDSRGIPTNWASSGARPNTWTAGGFPTNQFGPYELLSMQMGIVPQVTLGEADCVIAILGSNAFSPIAAETEFDHYYDGTWTLEQMLEYEATQLDLITGAWDLVLAANPDIPLLVGSFPPYTVSPDVRATYSDPDGLARLHAAAERLRDSLYVEAMNRGLAFFDAFAFYEWLYGHWSDPREEMYVGGNLCLVQSGGEDPTDGFRADETHPTTWVHALIANCWLNELNCRYDKSHQLFSEAQIAQIAGMSITNGADTTGINYNEFCANCEGFGASSSSLTSLSSLTSSSATDTPSSSESAGPSSSESAGPSSSDSAGPSSSMSLFPSSSASSESASSSVPVAATVTVDPFARTLTQTPGPAPTYQFPEDQLDV